MNFYNKTVNEDNIHILTRKEKVIVNNFVKIFKKSKKKISSLRMIELIGIAIDQTKIY